MRFSELDRMAAESVASVALHTRAAQALARDLPYLMPEERQLA